MALSSDNTSGVIVVSAPSGTGKTTLNRRLLTEHSDKVEMSISYTARPIRAGEKDGVDYHFVTPEAFRGQVARGEMLEYAEVFGKLYGTSLAEVRRIRERGRIVLLEIDVQGWRWAAPKLPGARSIFILPPSIKALWERLEQRGTEAEDVRWRRLETARGEIEAGQLYDSFIINDGVEAAYKELQDIAIQGKSATVGNTQGRPMIASLLAEFDRAPWIIQLRRKFADKPR